MKRSIYPENGRWNRAAIILSCMSSDMVEDILALGSVKGRDVLVDIFGQKPGPVPQGGGGARPLAILSNEYVSEADFEDVFRGLMTIILASLRKPSYGKDEYEAILTAAYSLPSDIARKLADRVETYDPVGSGSEGWVSKTSINVQEAIRKAVNYLPSILKLPWENDQDQKYDLDFMFEMKSLGVVVEEMNSRARLMVGQAMISSSYGIMTMGDVEDGDVVEGKIANLVQNVNRRQLPSKILGSHRDLANLGMKSSVEQLKHVADQAGYEKVGDSIMEGEPKNNNILAALTSLKDAPPAKALLLGGGLGLSPMIIAALKGVLGGGSHPTEQGGPDNAGLYSTIADKYGAEMADAWLTGDVDAMVGEVFNTADDDVTTGDTDMDDEIAAHSMNELGDVDDYSPEVGGILKKWRTNLNIRRANSKNRRAGNKSMKVRAKNQENETFRRAKQRRLNAGIIDDQSEEDGMPPLEDFTPVEDQGQEDMGGGLNEFYPVPN
jgi:hypothetical protein